jgi:hypothetical protein
MPQLLDIHCEEDAIEDCNSALGLRVHKQSGATGNKHTNMQVKKSIRGGPRLITAKSSLTFVSHLTDGKNPIQRSP